jgi:hypothetical protein
MEETDEALLGASLASDVNHQGTNVGFFKLPGVMTRVYEDEQGPICFARASKSLRVDIQFLDNDDKQRNAKVLAAGINPMIAAAKTAGYSELVFTTSNPELAAFCERVFGYEVVPDKYVLRKQI